MHFMTLNEDRQNQAACYFRSEKKQNKAAKSVYNFREEKTLLEVYREL